MTSLFTPILDVRNLTLAFDTKPVVNDLSFTVHEGKTLAIVGESGSGKSVTSLAIMGLLPYVGARVDSGTIKFMDGGVTHELTNLSNDEFRRIRGNDIAMIFQDPGKALNPTLTIGAQLAEVFLQHRSAEVMCGGLGECATKAADGGACGGCDYDICHVWSFPFSAHLALR